MDSFDMHVMCFAVYENKIIKL